MLSLSNCELGSEFSCNDGSCVPLEYKCDWFNDCSQGEDEVDCKALRLLNNYQKQVKKIIILTINPILNRPFLHEKRVLKVPYFVTFPNSF